MNIVVVNFIFLAFLVLNLLHWRFKKNEFWNYPPHSRSAMVIFLTWILASTVAACLALGELIPMDTAAYLSVGGLVAYQVYSIVMRHRDRVNRAQQGIETEPADAHYRWAKAFIGDRPPSKWTTWAPFQSPEVREIVAHLTPEEQARFAARSTRIGSKFGLIGVPLGIASGIFAVAMTSGHALLAVLCLIPLYIVGFYFMFRSQFSAIRRESVEMLCETEWARSRGYSPANVRLNSFPWSKTQPLSS